ncbi:MAG: site-specific integrase, partial [Deltaproteobacteria bacterium]|nr:site-specific integrase [Deltaproteobacteria bacterium]
DLLPRDLDLAAGTINVQRGKGGRQRVATLIGSAGGALIQRWLDRRHKLGLSGRCRLFCTLTGTPIAQSNVRQAFQRLKERAGIEKRVHPHGLRHSHAHYLSMTGKVPLTAIQGQLGHTNLTTTARYLDHLAPEARVAILRGID